MSGDCHSSAHHELQLGDACPEIARAARNNVSQTLFGCCLEGSIITSQALYCLSESVQELPGQYALSASAWHFVSADPTTRRSISEDTEMHDMYTTCLHFSS